MPTIKYYIILYKYNINNKMITVVNLNLFEITYFFWGGEGSYTNILTHKPVLTAILCNT